MSNRIEHDTSSVEKRMYTVSTRDNTGTSFNCAVSIDIIGKLDKKLFWDAWEKVVKRHDALRKCFYIDDNNNIAASVLDEVEYETEYVEADINHLDKIIADSEHKFDLSKAPLFYVKLIKYADNKHMFFLDIHHSIFDGTSVGVLFNDLLSYYYDETPNSIDYKYEDYVKEQVEFKKSEKYKKQQKYWKTVLNKPVNELKFPYDIERTAEQNNKGSEFYKDIDKKIIDRLKVISKNNHVSVYTLLLSVFHILIGKYSEQSDIISTIVLAGRPNKESCDLIGVFVNTLPIRTAPEEDLHFLNYIHEVALAIKNTQENQSCQLEDLLEFMTIKTDSGRNSLFDFDFNLVRLETIEKNDLSLSFYDKCSSTPPETTHADIAFQIIRNVSCNDHFRIFVSYKTSLLKTTTVKDFVNCYLNILSQIAYNPNLLIKDISLTENKEPLLLTMPSIEGAFTKVTERQRKMYFSNEIRKMGAAFNTPISIEINGNLNVEQLGVAFDKLVHYHEPLRTYFQIIDGMIVQCIEENVEYNKEYTGINSEELDTEIDSFVQPFDLGKPPLFRVKLFRIENDRHVLLLDVHPILCDRTSAVKLCKDLFVFYNDKEMNPLGFQLKDYAQSETIGTEWDERNLKHNYWLKKLKSNIAPLEFPLDRMREHEWSYIGDDVSIVFDKDITDKIKNLSKSNSVDLRTIMLTAYSMLLSINANQEDILIGVQVSGRTGADTEDMIGLFNDYLPFVNKITNDSLVKEQFQAVQKEFLEIQSNQHSFFNRVVKELSENTKVGRNPIFDFAFSHIYVENEDDRLNLCFPKHNRSRFDLELLIHESVDQLNISFNFKTSLFNKSTIQRLSQHYLTIVESIISNDSKTVKDIPIITDSEYQTIICDWNKTEAYYPKEKTVHQLFEEQVDKTPDNIAVVFEDRKLTYRELNEKSNQLAHTIRKNYNDLWGTEVKPDTLIGIYTERSLEMIVGILGIQKSGAAYVPFDSADPEERLKFKISDSGCKMILTSSKNIHNLLFLTEADCLPLSIDAYWNDISQAPDTNPEHINKSTDLAYIIYTSGSTGKPKGVMIEHKSLINTIYSLKSVYKVDDKHRMISAYASFAFDVSVSEFFSSLISGGELHIFSDSIKKDPDKLSLYLNENKINYSFFPPAILSVFPKNEYKYLDSVIFAGDTCDKRTGEYWSKVKKLYNYYGPTETTIYSTGTLVDSDNINNIGRPVNNTNLYMLNNQMHPVPIGVPGELYIGGDGLSRGYLHRPELTKERFIDNPFLSDEDRECGRNLQIYKTGDICRWLSHGDVEFIGRNDNQIKIRGFRIELGEIESKLQDNPLVSQCAVLSKLREPADIYLVAYYVQTDSEFKVQSSELSAYLSEKLPDYMIPSVFVKLEDMPLNASGKIDRKALPEPESKSKGVPLPPQNEFEGRLVTAWEEILGIQDIGVNDNFFDIGGHSIKVIQLKSKLEKQLGIEQVNVSDLFKYPTIRQFSEFILDVNQDMQAQYHINTTGDFSSNNKEIAVVACSGSFSGSDTVEEFWENIKNGIECIERLSKEECLDIGISVELAEDPDFISAGGRIKDIEKFDASFWGLSPKEASFMDPQIRKFIEHCWIVLEKSGYLNTRSEHNIGVFAGSGKSNYLHEHILPNQVQGMDIDLWEANTMSGSNYIGTRASYLLGLTGPSLNIDTACSTSLTAIEEACEKLSQNKCNIAIAGGSTLPLPDQHGYVYQEGKITSRDGHCRTFDINSSGTVIGAGVGVVLLKRLKDAERDGDNILAVVKGYALNNDGNRKVGYTAPSIIGQTECIINAQKHADVTSDTIDYVECHGTATKLGDPIEVTALLDAFKANISKDKKADCILGAVKANIGHTDSAAGVAGFIKVCKMLETETIPPQINYIEPNPELNFKNTPFKIVTEKQLWERKGHPRRAGVSAFGIGGTNAHVILEEYENKITEPRELFQYPQIIPISSQSRTALNVYKNELLEYIKSEQKLELADIAYSLQIKKEEFKFRNNVVCSTVDEALSKLKTLGTPLELNKQQLSSSPNIIFMFSGFGSQYPFMAKSIYNECDEFRKYLDRCIDIISSRKQFDFRRILLPSTNTKELSEELKRLDMGMPALFSVSYSLAKQFEKWGIKPDICIGHSIGEYAAAAYSGIFSLEEALEVVIERGKLMEKTPKGKMLTIQASPERVSKIINNEKLDLSVINAPEFCVISGFAADILNIKQQLTKSGIDSTELYIEHAAHSFLVESAVKPFENFISKYNLRKPNKKIISNLSGSFMSDAQATDPHYWSSHIRNTVLFSDGIKTTLNKYPNAVYIELGPGNVLSNFARQHSCTQKDRTGKTIPLKAIQTISSAREFKSLEGSSNNLSYEALGKLWCYGYKLDWKLMHKNKIEDLKLVPNLPVYQFDKIKCWIEKPKTEFNNGEKLLNEIVNALIKENVVISEATVKKVHKEVLQINKNEQIAEKKIREKVLIDDDSTELEDAIAEIFNDVLGIEQLCRHDDFFELGGNSLNALHVISKINKHLNINLSPSFMFANSTIHKIHSELSNNRSNNNIIINLRDGSEPPIFLIHPVGGEILFYRYFCNDYKGDNSIYAIQDPKYSDSNANIDSLVDMAELYLQEIRKIQKSGPYFIGGSSFGGLVAYEITNILSDINEEVLTFMIDSPGPKKQPANLKLPSEIFEFLVSNEEKETFIKTKENIDRIGDNESELIDYFISNKIAGFDDADLLMKNLNITKQNQKLLFNYFDSKPTCFKGKKVLFFKALEVNKIMPTDIEHGWKGLIDESQLELFEITGNHITMNEPPNVKKICDIIQGFVKS